MFLTDKIAFITNPDTDKTTYRWKKKNDTGQALVRF